MASIETSRIRAPSSGKMPTTSVRRLISRLKRSSGFVSRMKGPDAACAPDRLDARCVGGGEYGATVRDGGIWEQTRLGRPVLFDGLRARVSKWSPLRLARMRFEREYVGVVCPPSPAMSSEVGEVRQ